MWSPSRLNPLPAPGTWHRRDTLVAEFWPELDAVHARTGRHEEGFRLYRGEFLAGLFVAQSEGFERWVEGERARLRAELARAGLQSIEAGGRTLGPTIASDGTRFCFTFDERLSKVRWGH